MPRFAAPAPGPTINLPAPVIFSTSRRQHPDKEISPTPTDKMSVPRARILDLMKVRSPPPPPSLPNWVVHS
ncbi:hypothetical protein IMZ48_34480 [Candidatus Bathyarchaeota archaeon]|nr:hypothetical protein [Candidatus Bathyarchaeota archaeon]